MARNNGYRDGGYEALKAQLLGISRTHLNRMRRHLRGDQDVCVRRSKPSEDMQRDIATLDSAFAALHDVATRRMRRAKEVPRQEAT